MCVAVLCCCCSVLHNTRSKPSDCHSPPHAAALCVLQEVEDEDEKEQQRGRKRRAAEEPRLEYCYEPEMEGALMLASVGRVWCGAWVCVRGTLPLLRRGFSGMHLEPLVLPRNGMPCLGVCCY